MSEWTPGKPDLSTVAAVLALFLLVGGIGVLQTAIKVNQVTISDESYETAAYLGEYAEQHGWEDPDESYVFTSWGRNRMYNYFTNGYTSSYNFARRNYADFLAQGNPDFAVNTLQDGGRFSGVRFVVTDKREAESLTMQSRLHDNLGSRNGEVSGLGRFRAIYSTANEERRAFLFVPGATLRGTTTPNATVDVSTDITIPNASFTYERRTVANATGVYNVTVAHPGEYDVTTPNGTESVRVDESAVMNGSTVRVGS